jgi:hypothetical protein
VDARAGAQEGTVDVKEKQRGFCHHGLLLSALLEDTIGMARRSSNARLIAIAVLAAVLLLALIVATGGGLSVPSTATPTSAPAAEGPTPGPASGQIKGTVSVQARQVSGHTWQFLYTVVDTGNTPIGGFQLNTPAPANLFHISTVPGWTYFGAGVCGEKYSGVLIYWSTGPADAIQPRGRRQFGFSVNTTGKGSATYSLSYGAAKPQFGTVAGPKPSKLPATGSCQR